MDTEHVGFLRILTEDVQLALDRAKASNTLSDRRNLLRTIISAAEGVSWVYRAHVLFMAKEFDASTPLIELAFSEVSFSVSERGEIVKQARYVSLPAAIRLATKVAKSICPSLDVDFGKGGWQSLKDAIRTRNRITHPKNTIDLAITDADIDAAKAGFFWLLDVSTHVMEETIREYSALVADITDVADKLKNGDPDTLALYQRVHRDMED